VVREVYEETGLTMDLFELAGISSHVFDETDTRSGLHASRFIYRGYATGQPRITEIDGSVDRVAWVPFADIANLDCVELVTVGRTLAAE
jgi:ADP-ribose pyrophosphatase YjhB (NUDIX family)